MTQTSLTQAAVLALTVCGLAAAPASAQSPGSDAEKRLAQADANGDGNITLEEVAASRTAMFIRLDRNEDGIVDAADRPRGFGGRRFDDALTRVLAQFDANGDDRLTLTEMVDAPMPMFTAGDTDNDGVLTAEERAALAAQRAED